MSDKFRCLPFPKPFLPCITVCRILSFFVLAEDDSLKKGLSHLDTESVFFAPKLYVDTASGQKTLKRAKLFSISSRSKDYIPYEALILTGLVKYSLFLFVLLFGLR